MTTLEWQDETRRIATGYMDVDVLTLELGGYKAEISVDEDPMSPREWDNVGTLWVTSRCPYDLADVKAGDAEEVDEIIESDDYLSLPVYIYDHSGIRLSTSPFGCQWDSGQIGWIYAQKGAEGMSDVKILECLESEIKLMDQYVSGDVYGYSISDPDGNFVDSCYGFFGIDSVKAEAQDALKAIVGGE